MSYNESEWKKIPIAKRRKIFNKNLGLGKSRRRYDRHKKIVLFKSVFNTLSRHKRRDAVIRLKNRMRQEAHLYGGRFLGQGLLDEPSRPHLYDQYSMFYFPGSDGATIWNAYIQTAQYCFWNQTTELAFQRIQALLSNEEQAARRPEKVKNYGKSGKVISYSCVYPEERTYEQFGGMTYKEFEKKTERTYIE